MVTGVLQMTNVPSLNGWHYGVLQGEYRIYQNLSGLKNQDWTSDLYLLVVSVLLF